MSAEDTSGGGSSAGRAEAVLVKAFKTRNANIGERSKVPPSGGMIPRNMFKYGSQMVLRGLTTAGGALGNHVKTSRTTNKVLYMLKKFKIPLATTIPATESPGKMAAKF